MFALYTENSTTVYATEAEARAAQTVHPERIGSSVAPIDADQRVAMVTEGPSGNRYTEWEGPARNAFVYMPRLTPRDDYRTSIVVPAGVSHPRPADKRPATPADGVKVTKLARTNVNALEAAQGVGLEVALTATTATFPGTVRDALEALESATESLAARHGRRGHPVASLHAVRRRLEAL